MGEVKWENIEVVGDSLKVVDGFEFASFYQDISFDDYFSKFVEADSKNESKKFNEDFFAPAVLLVDNKLFEE